MTAAAAPIFLSGLSYSGKTPLRQVLGAHPDLALVRHAALWTRYWDRWDDLAEPDGVRRALDVLCADPAVQSLVPDKERILDEFLQGPPDQIRLFALFYEHHATRTGRSRWGEQLGPVDVLADVLLAAFPAGRMVHLVRDPRERLGAERLSRPGAIGWQTARWVASTERARRHAHRRPRQFMIVRYEDLAADPVATVRAVCEHCDLVPEEEVASAAAALSVAPPRRGGRRSRRAFISRHADEHLSALGYERDGGDGRRTPPSLEDPLDRCAMVAWRLIGRHVRQASIGA